MEKLPQKPKIAIRLIQTLTTSSPNETALTIAETLKSPLPTFRALFLAGLEFELVSFILEKVRFFVQLNYPSTDARMVAKEFTRTLFKTKPDWKEKEILTFLQFIMDNQGDERMKIYGNTFTITPLKLMEYVSFYEEAKSGEREAVVYELKMAEADQISTQVAPEDVKNMVEGMLLRINNKPHNPVSIKKALFDPIYNDLDFEVFKSTIPEMPTAECREWHDSITGFFTINKHYRERRNILLNLLASAIKKQK